MLTGNTLPIVYFSQKDSVNKTEKKSDDNSILENISMKTCENSSIYKDNILKFFGIENPISELPIDYGVIFTGMEYTFETIESMRESIKNEDV